MLYEWGFWLNTMRPIQMLHPREYKPSVQPVSQLVSQLFTSHMAPTPGTVIMLAGMVVLDKYTASYSNATHQKIQTPRSPQDALGSRVTPCGLIWLHMPLLRAHMVPYGPHMAHMAQMGPLGPIWSLMTFLWSICSHMALYAYAPIWSHMVLDGSIRAHMVPYGPHMVHMVQMGPLGSVWPQAAGRYVVSSGRIWDYMGSHMAPIWAIWPHMAPYGLRWLHMVRDDSI